ncbi:transposase [bacterium]|nr:MAG: transposase [bacterium]
MGMIETKEALEEEVIYHVISRGNNKIKVFYVGHDYRKYINSMTKNKQKYKFLLLAYALMPNHIHLMILTKKIGDLSHIMNSLSLSYSKWHNRRYGCVGHVWQGRYKGRIIKDDNDLLSCMAYIEMNPVRARLVNNPKAYKWSSCYERFSKTKDQIIDLHPVYLELSSDEQKRRKAYYEIMIR